MNKYRNLGNIDRFIRLLLSFVLLYLGLVAPEIIDDELINISLAAYGAINLLSTALGICPFYMMAGVSTYNKNKEQL